MVVESKLSIVIVNWNGGELLERCLGSIIAHPPAFDYEIIVVDNASSDQSLNWLRSAEAKALCSSTSFRLIANSENLGFSKANNQAFAASDSPLVFLLNPDTEVQPQAIDRLIADIRSAGNIGACGPRLLNTDGSLQPTVWRNPPAAWEILLSGLKLYRLLPARLRGELLLGGHWDHARRRFVNRLSGAALLIKREVIDQVGGLDERFFMYGEDVEWCLRIVRNGWLLLFEPEAVVIHHLSQSAIERWGQLEASRRVADGWLRYQRQTLSRPRVIVNLLASMFVASVSLVRRSITGDSTIELKMKLRLFGDYLKRELWFNRDESEAHKLGEKQKAPKKTPT